jgi:hypothetical protein
VADSDDLEIGIGITEREFLRSLARMEAQATKGAAKIDKAFERSNRTVVRGARDVERATKGMGQGLRNTSLQLSQVAQQGAVTGNYLQALAIQLPDLAIGLGTVGIAAGALAPIMLSVGQSFLKSAEDVKFAKGDLENAYAAATSAVEDARAAQDRYTAAIALTGEAQSAVTPEILHNLRLEAQAREALAAFELAKMEQTRRALERSISEQRERLDAIIADATAPIVGDANDAFVRGRAESERLKATQDILDASDDLVSSIRTQQAELDLVNSLLAQNHGEAAELVDELIQAATSAQDVAGAVSAIDFGSAIDGAIALSDRLDITLHKAMRIMGLVGAAQQAAADAGRVILDPRDPNFDEQAARTARIRDMMANVPTAPSPSRGGSGTRKRSGGSRGGRSAGPDRETLAGQREAQRYIDQTRTALEKYNAELAKLADLNARGFFKEAPEAYARAVAMVQEEFRNVENERLIRAIDDVSGAMANAIVSGENLGDALRGIFQQIAADLLRSNIQRLLGNLFGLSGGGGGGGLGGLLGGLLSFDGGGFTGRGSRSGGIDGKGGFPAILHPNESVIDHRKGGGAGGGVADVRVYVDESGNWQAAVERISGGVARRQIGQAAPAIASAAVQATYDRAREEPLG